MSELLVQSTAEENIHCKRKLGELRKNIDKALLRSTKGWITGRQGGRCWMLSRTKHVCSVIGALLILLAISPLMILIAIAIKSDSKGSVFFLQERTGFMGRRFKLYKFRTMVDNAEELKQSLRHMSHHGEDSPDFKIAKDPRITRVGGFLRRYSLDELPNLISVLVGDMRLVGPRPTSFHATTYNAEHLVRLSVYPGLTGLWQISGRSNIDFDGRVSLDKEYIEKQSFWLDIKILLLTPFKVIEGKGAC
ncbi:sugar transferase [Alkalimarinus coralli]|uniref:sugar transferase n=1 Tax=Alkalimarinus coralli TaxID=2935863 RepID=UPI00202B999C|nr:sugar transferase [Alkalimarinus coralli]